MTDDGDMTFVPHKLQRLKHFVLKQDKKEERQTNEHTMTKLQINETAKTANLMKTAATDPKK